jgi:hypothetical protein
MEMGSATLLEFHFPDSTRTRKAPSAPLMKQVEMTLYNPAVRRVLAPIGQGIEVR